MFFNRSVIELGGILVFCFCFGLTFIIVILFALHLISAGGFVFVGGWENSEKVRFC